MAPRIGAFHILVLLQTIASLSNSSGERTDDSTFDRKETRGNLTFGCASSGPCSPCSYTEKSDDETYHCSTSGYRQSYRCVELGSNGLNGHISRVKTTYHEKGGTGRSSSKKMSERVLQEDNAKEVSYGSLGRKVFEAEDVTTHDGRQVFHVYYSCLPTDPDEKLSVLGFEGIVLGLLAMSAPLIYHRRRRNFAMTGMTRLPTSARF